MKTLSQFLSSGTASLVFAFNLATYPAHAQFYCQTNLVSDLPNLAQKQDPDLVNPWGISLSSGSFFWVSDNGTGKSTLYDGNGVKQSLIVTIPGGIPTGTVFNSSPDFVIHNGANSGSSKFLFAGEDGTISGWNNTVNLNQAIVFIDKSGTGAKYKGITIANVNSQNFLYVANFTQSRIDVFDTNSNPVSIPDGFVDPNLPSGYSPFNIQNLGGKLYVAYAQLDPASGDEVAGVGKGFVDVFDPNGLLVHRLVSRIGLNAPWGLALAPANFGKFSNKLLVGNFGNGHIQAYDPETGTFLGRLHSDPSHLITVEGLWGIVFGNNANAGSSNTLFFAAGINGE